MSASPTCPGCIMAEECPEHGRLIPPGWTVDGDRYVCERPGLMCCWTYAAEDAWLTYSDNGAVPCHMGEACQ